jgi:sulfopyruvate decarboxylase subunit beta
LSNEAARMKRADCLAALYPELGDRLVVTIMGATAQELYDLGHRETFFYLQHAMGLASSIGLGLALNRPGAGVVVLDGDGSVLMNLGGLATLGRYRPPNLTHVVFDNGSLLSTGGFASHTTSGRTDLAAVARAAGCPRVREAHTIFQFMEAVAEAFAAGEMTSIVAKVEAVGPDQFHMDLALPENAFRFKRAVAATPEVPPARLSGG